MYQPLAHTLTPLVCLVSDDGNGEDREYLCLLSSTHMVEVNLKDNTHARYRGARGEYRAWKDGQLYQLGYRVCSYARFLAAQETYLERKKTPELYHTPGRVAGEAVPV